jgi:preprotein translocase subunit YajC
MRSEGASSGDSLLMMGLAWAVCVLFILSLFAVFFILYMWLATRRQKRSEKHH